MKAKEYAERYAAGAKIEDIATHFIREVEGICRTRKAHTDAAILSVFDEQDRKWRAFARRAEGINPDGFKVLIENELPDVYKLWRARRGVRRWP